MATANNRILIRTCIQALTVTSALLLAACAATQPQSSDVSEQGSTDSDAVAEQAMQVELPDSFEGDGMEIPLDGSSLAAFDASMARVKKHASEANYTTLENSIEYLLVYDLEVKRSKEKLAAKLDGLNGYEVVARTGWRKPPHGKSKVEKGSADAKIDT
jgi:hypothetical protein